MFQYSGGKLFFMKTPEDHDRAARTCSVTARHIRRFAWRLLSIFGLAALLGLTACRQKPSIKADAPMPTNAVARIGGFILTGEAFQAGLNQRSRGIPGRYESLEQKEALLDEMLRVEVIYQQALAAGYEQNPEILAAVRRLMIRKFEEDHLQARISPASISEEEIAAYYKTNSARFATPEKRQGAVIFIRVAQTASDATKAELSAKAESIHGEALKAASDASIRKDFGLLAQQHSDDQATRYKGGDMGWVGRDDPTSHWEAPVLEALFALQDSGEISPVITTTKGLYLVKQMEIKPATLRPLAEAKEGLQFSLAQAKEAQADSDFYAAQKGKTRIEVNRSLLGSITPPATQAAAKPPRTPGS